VLGLPVRYWMKNPGTAIRDIATDPADVWSRVISYNDYSREQRRPRCDYRHDSHWEQWLHEEIGESWPCKFAAEFRTLWDQIMNELRSRGIQPGPESYQHWNDGDAGFVRAIWCLVRHRRMRNVIETGVAHGVTSRFILEALERNGDGRLWSIDLPPLDRSLRRHIGIAVGDRFDGRWALIAGSSRRHLPGLLAQVGPVDLFVHDSLHSERNVRFELDSVWPGLKCPGAIVVDDIDSNWGFESFRRAHPGLHSAVCEAEPIRPDLRRFNQKGLFGVFLKTGTE
jgi:Methyltransferase domain